MRQPTTPQQWLIIIVFTILGVGCALLGRWGRALSTILMGLTLAALTSNSLRFCKARGFSQTNGMLLSLVVAASYILTILGSYGYFRG